jgi:hypothetical protein
MQDKVYNRAIDFPDSIMKRGLMNRRYFFLQSAAAVATARRSAASPNDTIRVACAGFHGQAD